MENKELYRIWIPDVTGRWSKFGKPALFVSGGDAFAFSNDKITTRDAPFHIKQLDHEKTMIIVDLPGASSVENGLRLAQIGYRPVPLYNGIHESKTGGLMSVVDNGPIVDALVTGANLLKELEISDKAGPAFLLDYNRDKEVATTSGVYDNRWSVDFEDMPAASYLKLNGISRVVLWTEEVMRPDLLPIVDSYRDAGIEMMTYFKGEFSTQGDAFSRSAKVVSTKMQDKVRKFENARFGLLLITIIAFVHLFFMFFVMDAPLLYTAPSLMWMTYLWVSYNVANFLAVVFPVIYLILYLKSEKKRHFMLIALGFFGIDVFIFYIYAFFIYGVSDFTEGYMYYGLLAFVPPLILLAALILGAKMWHELKDVSDATYLTYLDQLDGTTSRGSLRGGHGQRRRRRYRGYRDSGGSYRGYSGYGGTGSGGYKGNGYKGSGGGYGG